MARLSPEQEARIKGNSQDRHESLDAWSKVPDGTVLPSGVVHRRGLTQYKTTAAKEQADEKWVREKYGGQLGGGTINKGSPDRISPDQATSSQFPEPPPRTINRNDSRRLSAEEVQDLDSALNGLGPPATAVPDQDVYDLQQQAYRDNTLETNARHSADRLWRSDGLKTLMLEQEAKRKEEEERERRRIASKTAGRYVPQYYSGTQAQIYFDDVLIDEVVQIQYSTATNKMPIYGYASELFDTVASGNLLVQGSFIINFVEAGYLAIIGAALLERKFGDRGIGRKLPTETEKFTPGFMGRGALSSSILSMKGNSILTPGSYLSNQAINQVRGLGNKEFRELAREANVNKLSQSNQFSGAPQGYASRFDLLAPFDIYMIFGDYTDPDADHTVRRLKDVYLTGQAQTIISNGEPTSEVYNFIARTIE